MKFCVGPVGSATTELVTSFPSASANSLVPETGWKRNHRNQMEEGWNQNFGLQQNLPQFIWNRTENLHGASRVLPGPSNTETSQDLPSELQESCGKAPPSFKSPGWRRSAAALTHLTPRHVGASEVLNPSVLLWFLLPSALV